jgi:hypothetical protein
MNGVPRLVQCWLRIVWKLKELRSTALMNLIFWRDLKAHMAQQHALNYREK